MNFEIMEKKNYAQAHKELFRIRKLIYRASVVTISNETILVFRELHS